MAQKWLKATFSPLFKIEVVSKIYGEGASSICISDKDGNIIYQDTVTSRGHTVYYFIRKMISYSGKYCSYTFELKSKTTYDSYGEGNTSPITEVLTDFATNDDDKEVIDSETGFSNTYGGNLIVVVTYDAITNDSNFSNILKADYDKGFQLSNNVDIICNSAQNSFAFIGIDRGSFPYHKDCDFEYNIGKSSSLVTYILPSTADNLGTKPNQIGSIRYFTLSRKLDCYTRIYPYNDSSIRIGTPYATRNVGDVNVNDKQIRITNAPLYAGRTYYVKVKFRTRGDGNSTSSKCSSIGFIAWWNNWANARSYSHRSDVAYNEIGQIVEWTYSFTVNEDVQPLGTEIYFIVDNAWAYGYDEQTIDLYYVKYWDSEGNVYDERMHLGEDLLSGKFNSERSIANSTTNENYIWQVLPDTCKIDGETYIVDFYARGTENLSVSELFVYSSDYQTSGFITARRFETQTYTTHFSHTFTLKRNSTSSTLPNFYIRFDNNGTTNGSAATLYVSNVRIIRIRRGAFITPHFLRVKKGSELYYTSNVGERNYKGKYALSTPSSIQYPLHDTLEKLTYSDMEKLMYGLINNKKFPIGFEKLNFYVY